MEIREATGADMAAMWEIFRDVSSAGDTLPFSDVEEATFRAEWAGSERQPSFVAVEDARVVGMYQTGANRSGRGSHVATATYVVSPGAQGRGVGRALVEHSLAWARERGFLAMQFNYVVSTNAVAVRLYEKLGFAIVGTLPRAFRHRSLGLVDALVMYRFL